MKARSSKTEFVFVALLFTGVMTSVVMAKSSSSHVLGGVPPANVRTANLRAEVNNFLGKELASHLADIKTLEPPPDHVVGAWTTGEFSWGTFMYALARFSATANQSELAGRSLAKWVGQIGLIEAKGGGKAFSQLYAALALRNFGTDLKTNPLWQSLNSEEQTAWRSLLNPNASMIPARIGLLICQKTTLASLRVSPPSVTGSV